MKQQIKKWLALWGTIVLVTTGYAVTQTAMDVFVTFLPDVMTKTYIEGTILLRSKVMFWFSAYTYSMAFRAAFSLWWYWAAVALLGIIAWYGAKD